MAGSPSRLSQPSLHEDRDVHDPGGSDSLSDDSQSEGNTSDDDTVDEPEIVRLINSRCDSLNSKTGFDQFRGETQTSRTAKFILRRTQNKRTYLTKEQCLTASHLEPNPIIRKIRKLAYEFMNLKSAKMSTETGLIIAGRRVPATINSKVELFPRAGKNMYSCIVLMNDIQVGYHRGTRNKARYGACKKAIKLIKSQDIEVVPVEPEMKAVIAHDEEMSEKNFDAWQKYDGSLLNSTVNQEMSAGKNYDIVGGGLNFHQRVNLSSDHSLSGVRASEGVLASGQSPKLSLGNQNLSVIRKGPPCSHMKGVADSLFVTRDVCDVTAKETQSENVPDKGCDKDPATDPQTKSKPDTQNSEEELDNTGYKIQTSNTTMRSHLYNTPKINTPLSKEECLVAYVKEKNPVVKKIRKLAKAVLNIEDKNIAAKQKLKMAGTHVSVLVDFKSEYVPSNPSGNYLHRVLVGGIELASNLGMNKNKCQVRKTACEMALKAILMPKIKIDKSGCKVELPKGSDLPPEENLSCLTSTTSKTFLEDSAEGTSQLTKLPGERTCKKSKTDSICSKNQSNFQEEFINTNPRTSSKTFLGDSAEGSSRVTKLPRERTNVPELPRERSCVPELTRERSHDSKLTRERSHDSKLTRERSPVSKLPREGASVNKEPHINYADLRRSQGHGPGGMMGGPGGPNGPPGGPGPQGGPGGPGPQGQGYHQYCGQFGQPNRPIQQYAQQQYGGQPHGWNAYGNQQYAQQQYGGQPHGWNVYGNQQYAQQQYGGQPQGWNAYGNQQYPQQQNMPNRQPNNANAAAWAAYYYATYGQGQPGQQPAAPQQQAALQQQQAAPQQPPIQQQQPVPYAQSAINPQTGQLDYSQAWIEHYFSQGLIHEAKMVMEKVVSRAAAAAQGGQPGQQ